MAEVVATSQQSRFHTETLDTPCKDVDLKAVTLTIGNAELLTDAHLRLYEGVHYGLIGRNGVGKSTLLKAIGYGMLIGFPKSVRALYVDQLEDAKEGQSVLQTVLQSDRQATRVQRDLHLLQAAVEGGDAQQTARSLRTVRLGRLQDELEAARQLAVRRSGARGFDARHEQVDLEARVEAAKAELEASISAHELECASQAAQDTLDDLFAHLDITDGDAAEAKARRILKGLRFSTKAQDGPLSQLSGGWRIRVALAQALFLEPDLLLLDEPTNHLDLPAILWLQTYLQSLTGTTLVIVSHDRTFLNATAEEIIVFRNGQLTYHTGNYDEYQRNTEEILQHQVKLKESIDKKRSHIEKSIQEGMRNAKKTGDDKKLGMVASRKKKLDRLGVESNAKGHAFKLNRDRAGYYNSNRDEVVIDTGEPVPSWKLPVPSPLRHQGPLLQLEGVSFKYGRRPSTPMVLQGVTLNVEQGARVGIVGANGEGKSTLVKLITGQLEPLQGTIQRHTQAKVAVYAQNQVEELRRQGETVTTAATAGAAASASPAATKASALSHLQAAALGGKEQELRGHLASFGIKGQLATRPISALSGGQAVRVALAAVLLQAPHLLIVDEPTNHLDMDSVAAMLEAFKGYQGAIIVVSHDQHFISSLVQEVYLVEKGAVVRLEGGVAEYVKKLKKRLKL